MNKTKKNHSHYYTSSEIKKDEIYKLKIHFREKSLELFTSSGVFSKDGLDFGTRLLAESFIDEKPIIKAKILDMGSSYGALSFCIKSIRSDLKIDMVDVNSKAIYLAKKNIELLNFGDELKAFESDLYSNIKGKYDYILSNPPIRAGKKIVHEILEKSKDYLSENGMIFIVIQKKQGAKSALAKLKENFKDVVIINSKKGYKIIAAKKFSKKE